MSWTSSVSLEQVKVKNEISLELRCVYVASCRPEFESQANHPCFLSFLVKIELFICLCGVKRTKINRKRPYLAHIKNDYKDIYRNVKAANFECLQSSVTRCWSKKVAQLFPKVVLKQEFLRNFIFFKLAQKSSIFLGYFCWQICSQEL